LTNRKFIAFFGTFILVGSASAQVPDLLNAFDSGARSQGAGGALNGAAADTYSTVYNPAGLGYVNRPTLQLGQRNLPSTRTAVTGTFNDQNRAATRRNGSTSFAHFGYAIPGSAIRKGEKGSFGVSYSVTGLVDDLASATGDLAFAPGIRVRDFTETKRVRTDFLSFGYGRTNAAGNLAVGYGIVFANQSLTFRQTGALVDGNGDPISGGPSVISFPNVKSQTSGVGVMAGVQYSPPNNPNASFNASVRSPIRVGGGGSGVNFSTIPGRVMLGAALRYEGYRKGKDDYLVVGANTQFFFGGQGSSDFERGSQGGFGLGLEYNLDFGRTRVPLRLGYQTIGSSGTGYDSYQTLTYGIGYQPGDGRYTIDFSYARPRSGGQDTYITATYRF